MLPSFSIGRMSQAPTELARSETLGQGLHCVALSCIRPIDYTVEYAIRSFITCLTPSCFDNCSFPVMEVARRTVTIFALILALPITLSLYILGQTIDMIGDLLTKKPHDYLKGKSTELHPPANNFTVLSANLCMLPYGIHHFAGLTPPHERIEQAASLILEQNTDFLCLQELSPPHAKILWEKVKHIYAHGLSRIGGMPLSRMGSSLFFASKYSIEETRFYPLPNNGAITRGLFCAKTNNTWILNTHLSAGEQQKMRKEQVDAIQKICALLVQETSLPCLLFMDGNILRTGKADDEYTLCGLPDHFQESKEQKTFVLSEETATCTNIPGFKSQGKKIPSNIEKCFEHIDYALVYKSSKQDTKISTTKIRPQTCLSDHDILISQVKLI